MFLESSRYSRQKTEETVTGDGRPVRVVTLRRLPRPPVKGTPTRIKANDRLDIIAQDTYKDPTMFWHIADANTELQANELVREPGRIIKVPEQ